MGSLREPVARWRSRSGGLACLLGVVFLTACPTVDLGDNPTDLGVCIPAGGIDYFRDEIWTKYVRHGGAMACTQTGGCHNEAGGNELAFKTQGCNFSDANDPCWTFNYRHVQNFLSCATPSESELMVKPLAGRTAHGGGDLVQTGDAAYMAFLAWFM
jgi:hypothetical protein